MNTFVKIDRTFHRIEFISVGSGLSIRYLDDAWVDGRWIYSLAFLPVKNVYQKLSQVNITPKRVVMWKCYLNLLPHKMSPNSLKVFSVFNVEINFYYFANRKWPWTTGVDIICIHRLYSIDWIIMAVHLFKHWSSSSGLLSLFNCDNLSYR